MIWSFVAAMIVAFLFAGLEAGLASVNRIRLRQRARQGQPEAVALDELFRNPASLLTSVLLFNLLARILVLSFLYVLLTENLPPLAALLLVLLALAPLALLLDFFPKLIFRQSPYRRVLLLAGILRWLSLPIAPLGKVLKRLGGKRFERTTAGGNPVVTAPAELREAINSASLADVISPLQKHYLHSILNTRSLGLSDLSSSLDEMPFVEQNDKVSLLLERAGEEKQDAYFVRTSEKETVGVIFVFDLLLDGIRSGSCQSYMRRLPVLTPGDAPIIALLKMRAARASLALVIDKNSDVPLRVIAARTIVARLLHGHH
jgi:putative hemolysin